MTENQIILLAVVFGAFGRIPRILERWKAPLLRGPKWFFGVAVAPDFLRGPGASLLRNYRLRLFIPWMAETPLYVALLFTHRQRWMLPAIAVIVLLTRINYYAARSWAERRARPFAVESKEPPVSIVALSLETRTLGGYTNPWTEAAIGAAILGTLAWIGYRYFSTHDWNLVRAPLAITAILIYLQAGLLLVKQAFVRARSAVPAENAEQYIVWRDSLRRLSTANTDVVRLMLSLALLSLNFELLTPGWAGSVSQAAAISGVLSAAAVGMWFEWRRRVDYLKIARETKPGKLVVTPAIPDAGRIVFRPALPAMLLRGSRGISLNLASAPARVTGLYVVGFAVLWLWLTR